jgi:hypothetical protein
LFWLIHYRCISSKFHDYPAARVNLPKIWCLHDISQQNLPFLPSAVGFLHFGICLFYICTSQVNKYTLPDEKHCVSCPWNSFLMWTHKSTSRYKSIFGVIKLSKGYLRKIPVWRHNFPHRSGWGNLIVSRPHNRNISVHKLIRF